MIDELVYSELAKSFAAHGQFLVRGVPRNGYGFVYPVLIAPAWRLFGSVPDAYAAAKAINAVVMSLAAIPAYFLARRLLTPRLALVAAALTVLVPSMLYTGTLMTENAFYPLFLLAALVLVLTLERPTRAAPGRCCSRVCGLAFATRAQAVALFAAALAAPILLGLIERDLRAQAPSRSRRSTGSSPAAPSLALARDGRARPLAARAARRLPRRDRPRLLGRRRRALPALPRRRARPLPRRRRRSRRCSRSGSRRAARSPGGARVRRRVACRSPCWLVRRGRRRSRRSSRRRIEERNIFYVAPLALIALLGLAARRRRPAAPARRSLAAAARRRRAARSSSRSPASSRRAPSRTRSRCCRGGGCRTTGSTSTRCAGPRSASRSPPPRSSSRCRAGSRSSLPALVAAYFVLASVVVENGRHGIHQASVGALWAGHPHAAPRLDRPRASAATPTVAFLWHYAGDDAAALGERVLQPQRRHRLHVDGPDPADGGAARDARARAPDGTARHGDRRVAARPVRASRTADIAGHARSPAIPASGSRLYRVDGPLVILTRVPRPLSERHWSGGTVTYRRRRLHRRAAVGAPRQRPALCSTRDQVVTARPRRPRRRRDRDPADRRSRRSAVPLRPDARRRAARSRFTVAPLRVPARVQPGSTDTRALGAHFLAFAYTPMRIAFDVSPALARADGRQQLHPRLARAASPRSRRERRATRSSRSRRPRPRARASIPEALAGIAVELRLVTLPGAHGWRTAWSRLGWPPRRALARRRSTCSTSPTGCTRRSAPACARRRSTTSCRSTSRSG